MSGKSLAKVVYDPQFEKGRTKVKVASTGETITIVDAGLEHGPLWIKDKNGHYYHDSHGPFEVISW